MLYLTPAFTVYCCFVAALLGACMGSFLNCMAWRVVHGESVLRGRSHCDVCGHVLTAGDLIPVVSYLVHRGRCRWCGAKLSARHVWGEAAAAVTFTALLLRYDISLQMLEALLLACVLLACAFADLEGYIIPDRFVAAGAILRIPFFFLLPDPKGQALDALLGSLAVGGGLAKPSQAFKALALGAPYVKAVCMSRSFMIPAFLGCNIEGALHPERRERVHGAWSALPKTVLDIGDTPETIFAGYHALKERLGADEMAHIPYGAIAMWTMCDRLGAGLQHHMAGARKFSVEHIDRTDICAANRETAQETGIPFITEQDDELARRIVLG